MRVRIQTDGVIEGSQCKGNAIPDRSLPGLAGRLEHSHTAMTASGDAMAWQSLADSSHLQSLCDEVHRTVRSCFRLCLLARAIALNQ